MMNVLPRCRCRQGFTLIELLVVITIIGILSGIAFGVYSSVARRADVTAGQQILREHGNAIQLFVADNDGKYPGPLWPGQIPIYDEDETGRLVVQLAEYLGVDTSDTSGEVIRELVPPLYFKEINQITAPPRTFVVQLTVEEPGGYSYQPFGSLINDTSPRTAAVVTEPATTWLMSDADQEHPLVTNAPWAGSTPAEPLTNNHRRNVLFFDGHVESVGREFNWVPDESE